MSGEHVISPPERLLRQPAESASGCAYSDLKARLRFGGLGSTRQRMSLAWLQFGKGHRHVTAEQLYAEATKACIPLSLATICNTLQQFTEADLLRQFALVNSKAYFDSKPTEHHDYSLQDEGTVVDAPHEGVIVMNFPTPKLEMVVAGMEA